MKLSDGIKVDTQRHRHSISWGSTRVTLDWKEEIDPKPFLRLGVETKQGNAWEWISDASVVTRIPRDAAVEDIKAALGVMIDAVYEPLQFGDNIHKLASILSRMDDIRETQRRIGEEAADWWERDKHQRRTSLNSGFSGR
jgi:hypothetical protein